MRGLIAGLAALAATPAAAQQVDVGLTAQTDGTRAMIHEITVPASVDDVWSAVATVDGWRTWAVPIAQAAPGAPDRFQTGYQSGVDQMIEQQWIEQNAPRTAAFRTTKTPKGFPHAEAYGQVISRFTLTPLGPTSTRVRLEGAGYPPGPAGDALIAFFREGNRISLRQLHTRFSTGPIDWSARGLEPKEK